MTISEYIKNINTRYKTGISIEYVYRWKFYSSISDSVPHFPDTNPVNSNVQINDEQYMIDVPLKAWEFYIGVYQPAEKWLKDRRDRTLSMEEIQHYQKIIVALMETDRLMREIDWVNKILEN